MLFALAIWPAIRLPWTGAATFPGVADLFYLVRYPIVTLASPAGPPPEPRPGLGCCSMAILTVGLALVSGWPSPIHCLRTGISALGRAISVVYLIATRSSVSWRAVLDSEAGTPHAPLRGSVVALLLADGLSVGAGRPQDSAGEAAYFAQLALWAAAALHPSIATSARPSEKKESAFRRAGWPP